MTWQDAGKQTPPSGPDDEATRPDWEPAEPAITPSEAVPPGGWPPAVVPPPPAPPAGMAPGTVPPTSPPPAQGWGQPGGTPAGGYPEPGGYSATGVTWGPSTPYGVAPASIRYAGALPRFLAYWLDGILVGIVAGLVGGIVGAAAGNSGAAALTGAIIGIGVSLLYFLGFWTSSGRATPGMRLFNLQIGAAGDGRTLSMGQAAIRWVALGSWIQGFALLPGLGGLLGLVSLAWAVALLVTTVTSPTKQGIHDRLADSAIVQPIGRGGPVIPCLILLVLLFVVLPLIALVGLIAVGTQVTEILSEVGTSI
jgi:uncharacterized RDD family membrane protein YckC